MCLPNSSCFWSGQISKAIIILVRNAGCLPLWGSIFFGNPEI